MNPSNLLSKSFKYFLLFAFLCLPVFPQSVSENYSLDSLNFLFISDFGGQGGKIQREVAAQLGKIASIEKTKFVITGGDNYHQNGISDAHDSRWQTEYEEIYSSASLMVPWYASLGNHDYLGSPDAEIMYSQISNRWKMPARYYTHVEKINDTSEALFVHIDTSPFITEYRRNDSLYNVLGQDTHSQLHWIDSVLAYSHASWKIVIGHHPIYSSVENHGNNKELIDSVLPLLQKYNVRIYLCGHEHFLQYLVHGNTNFFVCGGGALSRPVSQRDDVIFGVGSPGFMSMTLTSETARTVYFDEKGNNLFSTTIHLH
ncbi:MAG: tartrate-resistant acid phosphatase type 5 family protein [Ignavibacteriaceae bacterium]|nr:tartrate-resistant acid phosphatase type 5 family protein [Ignavibacteriaceae bacterium]